MFFQPFSIISLTSQSSLVLSIRQLVRPFTFFPAFITSLKALFKTYPAFHFSSLPLLCSILSPNVVDHT